MRRELGDSEWEMRMAIARRHLKRDILEETKHFRSKGLDDF
jgi:hypothetical protein